MPKKEKRKKKIEGFRWKILGTTIFLYPHFLFNQTREKKNIIHAPFSFPSPSTPPCASNTKRRLKNFFFSPNLSSQNFKWISLVSPNFIWFKNLWFVWVILTNIMMLITIIMTLFCVLLSNYKNNNNANNIINSKNNISHMLYKNENPEQKNRPKVLT